MTLSSGRHTLAIPGPSIMPDRVLRAMHRAAPNIYTGELIEITESLLPDLQAVARTTADVAMYIGNGHAVWEASLVNTHSRGDHVLAPASGLFARGWADYATRLGLHAEIMDFGHETPVDPDAIEARLRQDTEHKFKSVLLVHSDTSTSIRSDVFAVRRAIDAAGHPAMLMVDCMASLGCEAFEMDAWGVDLMVAGCQKGLMTPPGMAFIFAGDRARKARQSADLVTPYWDWETRITPERFYMYWSGTAPTHHIYGLREALTMMVQEEGMTAVWARHETLARGLWAACDRWAQGGALKMRVQEPEHRSHAVTALTLPKPQGNALREYLSAHLGVTLGIGLPLPGEDISETTGNFRIGHMGHLSAHTFLGTLGTVETGLRALNIPIGEGALSAAAQIYAKAAH